MSSKSFDKATREWVQIRKKLYLQIKSDVQRLLGDVWKEFIPLEKKYAKELGQPWRSVAKEMMYEHLQQSDVILLGDFHALQQSQRGHLRLMREWPNPSGLVLAVEFFQARHQKFIDQFLKGRLSEKVFLEKISWAKSWGFPWEHYKPLLDWAMKHNVPIYGINWGLRQTKMGSIKTREHFSAVCLRKIHQQLPLKKLVVIYGDLHLSKDQLPTAIRRQEGFRRAQILKVFQNYEPLYFKALEQGIESKIETVQFRSGDFCIQSVPPWVKWQSYLLFLENTFDLHLEDFIGTLDHTDHVAKLVEFLSAEFRLKIKGTSLAVYTADDTNVYARIRGRLARREWKVVQRWITEQRTFYVPELELGYLGRVTVNHTATLAGEYLHAFLSERKFLYFGGAKDFERQIWIQSMAYLGSKIINHKRKTNSIEDLRRTLLLGEGQQAHRKVVLLALHQKVREISFMTSNKWIPLKKIGYDDANYVDAARILGSMMGEKIYQLYRDKHWSTATVLKLLRMPLEPKNFKDDYYKHLKLIFRANGKF
jgi:hypothetical protein